MRRLALVAALSLLPSLCPAKLILDAGGRDPVIGDVAIREGKRLVAKVHVVSAHEKGFVGSLTETYGQVPLDTPMYEYYRKGKLHAVWKAFSLPDGHKHMCRIEAYYPNGRLELKDSEGDCSQLGRWYYESGVLEREVVKREDGPGRVDRMYDARGRLERAQDVDTGPEPGLDRLYYPNGKVESEFTTRDGVDDGPARLYYEDGTLKTQYLYRDGKQDGPMKSFSRAGKLEIEAAYAGGVLNGLARTFFEDGRTVKEMSIYKNGVAVLTEDYDRGGKLLKRKQPGP